MGSSTDGEYEFEETLREFGKLGFEECEEDEGDQETRQDCKGERNQDEILGCSFVSTSSLSLARTIRTKS